MSVESNAEHSKSSVSAIKWVLHHIISILLLCLITGIMAFLGDLILSYIINPGYTLFREGSGRNPLNMTLFYSGAVVIGLYISFWIVPIILVDLLYRVGKIGFRFFQLLMFILSILIAWKTKNETYSFYIHSEKNVKHVIITVLAGIIYPYLSKAVYRWLNKFSGANKGKISINVA